LFFHWQRGYPEPYRNVAVRKGRYKLVGHAGYNADINDLELFDLEKDPYELNNLNEENPEKVTELKNEFDQWLDEALSGPNVKPQRIRIGTKFENPVILNRNDAKGSAGIWAQEKIYGYWDVEVMEDGLYDFKMIFHKPIENPGSMIIRLGNVQRTYSNQEINIDKIILNDIPLKKGEFMLESWYWQRGGALLPFYIEVSKKDLSSN
jgi:arylsulfatase